MSILSRSWKCAGAALAGLGLVGVSACDNPGERVERAQALGKAALDQVSGAAPRESDGPSMAAVPVLARAFAGQAPEQPMQVQMAQPRSRFAVGSIIAKPRDLPPPLTPQEALIVQAPELAGELEAAPEPQLQQAPAMEAPSEPEAEEDETAARSDLSRSLRQRTPAGELIMPKALPREQIKMARREIARPEALVVQNRARTTMLETMSEFGLAGQVEMTRAGQMVIQIGADGADPTQFSGQRQRALQQESLLFTPQGATRPDLPALAIQADIDCPDEVQPAQIRANPVLATECMVRRLQASGEFEYVEKDFIFEHQFIRRPSQPAVRVPVTPDDPLWSLQWNFFNNGEGELASPGGAGFVDFWTDRETTGSDEVVVAVIDTGLDMDHPDIDGSLNIAPGWDMVSDPRMGNDGDGRDPDANDPGDLCDPSVPFSEDSFHGTHVAGTIGAAASDNAAGVAGGAWNVTIVPVRALGKCGGRLTDINDAIRWAGGLVPAFDTAGNEVWNENPADIINLSIGLFEFCPASLQDAINAVTERGVVVVSAAGNARIDTRFYSPGGCENVLSVAAGDARGAMAPYSNYGEDVDILAPGGDLARDDNGDGRPDGILSTRLAGNCFDPVTGDPVETCYYAFEQGTSMAAPHVSAALALIKSVEPELMGTSLSDRLLAALEPRSAEQCAGPCSEYPGTEPLAGSDTLCRRPCGGGLLNLANVGADGAEP